MEEVSRRFSNEGFSAPLMLGLPDPFPFSPVFIPAQLIVYFPSANRFERCGVAVDSHFSKSYEESRCKIARCHFVRAP